MGLLLGQLFADSNKNVGMVFTVEFDNEGLIKKIEMYPPELIQFEAIE